MTNNKTIIAVVILVILLLIWWFTPVERFCKTCSPLWEDGYYVRPLFWEHEGGNCGDGQPNRLNNSMSERFGIHDWSNQDSKWVDNVSPWYKSTIQPCIKCRHYTANPIDDWKNVSHLDQRAGTMTMDSPCYAFDRRSNKILSTCKAQM